MTFICFQKDIPECLQTPGILANYKSKPWGGQSGSSTVQNQDILWNISCHLNMS